ncbi:23S rRNA (adenine(2030)-N(6))-methyltransferase RlmJ [Fluviibacterium sp. DFM31]|uniref:Ribosomal RNA large subunit methyltransferase J n=1 Tax=Meridianimarinicoccus marinus TaxID=3231483 RepID=A0ABV3L380_9RHOB
MLSYQHIYHAGNAADVHKHALLALALDYLTRKPKPLTYLETHAGRALYDLSAPEAEKTGEATAGIGRMERWFAADHPYARCLAAARERAGAAAYPGSPLIASTLLRPEDRLVLAELHPREVSALRYALPAAEVLQKDGPELALSLTPPTPRRGLLLVDPSYEVKTEFETIPTLLSRIRRKWPVGVLMLWYPILASGAERPLVARLKPLSDDKSVLNEVRFPPARPGHGMIGSGLWVANAPWGFAEAAQDLAKRFATLA